MALTQTDLDRLDTAIAAGVLEVEEDGQRIRYDSAAALMQRRAYVAGQIAAAAASASGTQQATRYPTFILSRER